ncbi:MAG: ImpA family metalloprotease [Pseudomonadota bacterium]
MVAPPGKENQLYEYRPLVSDADGDDVHLSIERQPSWLQFDSNRATFSGMPSTTDIGSHPLIVVASDGIDESRAELTITITADDIEEALRTGSHTHIKSASQVLPSILSAIESNQSRYTAIRHALFGFDTNGEATPQSLTDVSWDPSQDSALLRARFGRNEAILTTNAVTHRSYIVQQRDLGIIGLTNQTRYAVFGGNPMRDYLRSNDALSADMTALFNNTLRWLLQHDAETASTRAQPSKVVVAQLDQSHFFPDQKAVGAWLEAFLGNDITYNEPSTCDRQLSTCLVDADLLIVSSYLAPGDDAVAIARTVQAAIEAGTAVLYVHHDGQYNALAQRLLGLLDVDYHGDNYWRRLSVESAGNALGDRPLPDDIVAIRTMVERLVDDTFTFTFSGCEDKTCPANHPYPDEFLGPVETLQGQLRDLDQQKVRIFDQDGYRFHTLLVLLGDYFRARVRFPMDIYSQPRDAILKSLFADHTVYHHRDVNPAQSDMGNFSRSDFSTIAPVNRRVSMTSKTPFRSTGAYALPGVPFTVTRMDSTDVTVSLFVNTLRPGATHEFEAFGYTRPKYVQSARFAVAPGETLSITSPHGGPIQLEFGSAGHDVEFTFSNVGEHPYWQVPDDDEQFAEALTRGDYDWAEVSTPNLEVHSTLDKMRITLSNPGWPTGSELASLMTRFTHHFPHALAGLDGPGIETDKEVTDFAAAHGLRLDWHDEIKHMNADQATCGYGCSGNPYDAYWAFDPLGHGDLHELGHGLERTRFLFKHWDRHAITDPYSYYTLTNYVLLTGDSSVLASCQTLPFKELFDTLQAAARTDDPVASMTAASPTSWHEGSSIYLQLMMRVQADGALNSGWHLLPRLHILEREFSRADDSDDAWLAKRDGLGFSNVSRTQARQFDNNDWLLIALSHAAGRDLRAYLQMWGLTFSETARSHVKAMNLPSLPPLFHAVTEGGQCLGLDHPAIAVDGLQSWPSMSR